MLDLANPKVQDFIFGMVDNLMTNYPEIDYIKWDANMSIMNHGSNYLSDNDQSHMYIAYHKGFETICQRIRAKYPEVTIQACASGGGRVNYGLLPYFDEFWVMLCNGFICNGEHLIFSRQLQWLLISAHLPIIRLSVVFH